MYADRRRVIVTYQDRLARMLSDWVIDSHLWVESDAGDSLICEWCRVPVKAGGTFPSTLCKHNPEIRKQLYEDK